MAEEADSANASEEDSDPDIIKANHTYNTGQIKWFKNKWMKLIVVCACSMYVGCSYVQDKHETKEITSQEVITSEIAK